MSQVEKQSVYTGPSEDKLLDHNYDGIQEYDNPMPGWWKAIFWISVIFSPFYVFYYQFGAGASDHDNYKQEMKAYHELREKIEAQRAKAPVTDQIAAILKDKKEVDAGKKIFMGKGTCFTCHGNHGEGKIGPNLTDNYWIHGPRTTQIFHVIRVGGREGKGMIPWGKVLKYKELLLVTAYVESLKGTKPSNPKPPEKDAKLYKK